MITGKEREYNVFFYGVKTPQLRLMGYDTITGVKMKSTCYTK